MTLSQVACLLNAMPFVTWDRCVRSGDWVDVYGWIDRDPHAGAFERKDFVVIEVPPDAICRGPGKRNDVSFTTSSARWSQTIYEILHGEALPGDRGHNDCIPVNDEFGDLVERKVVRDPAGGRMSAVALANPWGLDATGLLMWGLVAHLVADVGLQTHWMAAYKAMRRQRDVVVVERVGLPTAAYSPDVDLDAFPSSHGRVGEVRDSYQSTIGRAWDRHPAAYVHAGVHAAALTVVFGWVALPLAAAHLLIDTRTPVVWWGRLLHQTLPGPPDALGRPTFDVGVLVRMMLDQVFHVVTIAAAALLVGA